MNSKGHRARLWVMWLALLALAAAACADADTVAQPPPELDLGDEGEQEAVAEGTEVQLRMTWWGSDFRHQLTQQAIEAFNDAHPEIGIIAEFLGWDGYWERLNTQIAGGNPPDIIQMDYRMLNEYVARDTLLRLDDHLGAQLDLSEWSEDTYASGMVDGELYAVPWGLNTSTWLISEQGLEMAGVEPPDDTSWTWDDLRQLAQEIADSTEEGYHGTADNGGNEPLFESFLIQRGKSLYTEDGELGFEQQDLTDWWTMWDDMRRSGAAVPAELTSLADGQPENTPIVQETAAMDHIHSNQYEAWSATATIDFLLMRLPGEQPGQYLKPSMFLSGSAATEHPEQVATFIDFIVNDPEVNEILGLERGVPGNPLVRDSITPVLSPTEEIIADYLGDLEEFAAPTPQAPPPGAAEVDNLLDLLYEAIIFEQASIEEQVERFFQEAPRMIGQ